MIQFLLTQIAKIKSKIGNVGNTDIQSQINTLSDKMAHTGDIAQLLNEEISFTTEFGYLNKSFTLTKNAVVRVEAAFNNSRPVAIGIKAGTGDYNQILGWAYVDEDKVSTKATGLGLTTVLQAGTYYLWGQANAEGDNTVVVRAMTFN